MDSMKQKRIQPNMFSTVPGVEIIVNDAVIPAMNSMNQINIVMIVLIISGP